MTQDRFIAQETVKVRKIGRRILIVHWELISRADYCNVDAACETATNCHEGSIVTDFG